MNPKAIQSRQHSNPKATLSAYKEMAAETWYISSLGLASGNLNVL